MKSQAVSSWSGVPTLEYFDGDLFRVVSPLSVELCSGDTVTVKPQFLTDGITYPRLLWSILGHPFDGVELWAAMIHDWLCVTHQTDSGERISREQADSIFYKCLKSLGVSSEKSLLMYTAVRCKGKWNDFITPEQKRERLFFVELRERHHQEMLEAIDTEAVI
jgi:hypothetical protein